MIINRPIRQQDLRRMAGVTLIELMISILIGLIILAALSVMYVNQTRVRAELDKNNRMTDNGRFAIETLAENVKHAGYFGELDPTPLTVPAFADPCTTNPALIAGASRLAVQGISAPDLLTAPVLPATCGLAAGMLKPGSDILIVRRVETKVSTPSDGGLYLQASLCDKDVDPYKLSLTASDFTLRAKDCAAAAPVRRVVVQIYFVSPNNRPGDGVPTLKRLELAPQGWVIPKGSLKANGAVTGSDETLGAPGFVLTPLVEGIEFLQVDFGVDSTNTDGLAVADSYVAAPACPTASPGLNCDELSNVVDVKIHLVARNTEATAFYRDDKRYQLGTGGEIASSSLDRTFKRQTYSQFVRLINVAGRRETP